MEHLPKKCGGIYLITLPDGTRYIGRTKNFRSRYRAHRMFARKNKHQIAAIQNAFNIHGETALCMTVIMVCAKRYQTMFEAAAIQQLMPEHNGIRPSVRLIRGTTVYE